ncbi:relaxase/mobilization nuclease domain-containing protein [Segetibacter aerophilus]|uniref:Mobilization protein n=1 Tax=Segetibacter aerophilus TaxID=670293 RepID=A0A512BIK7_9BACT|nr:relaxase/mobilization nuclease domain-containing protein [Segetibacter aerophilus]GEO11791.1 mobilization protein [Segetibacter aerophilus]
MVARIKKTKSLSNAVNYNEKKVQQNQAECINAANYAKDPEQLNFYQKLHRLEHQAALNERVIANSVHISLNFDAVDKLDKEKLNQIADSYMQQIGFGKQPYLVYQHFDAGHQHIHIVSTNITADGSRIEMNNIGKNQSEQARKKIEIEFKLVQAESKKQQQTQELKAVSAQRIIYGKTETKRAITNVLNVVLPQYKYTSLPELNAVLKLYNVMADRGPETSKMYEGKGLVYRVLDEKGNKIGTPIKASAFYSKPTLPWLEQKFKENDVDRQQFKRRLKTKIDLALLQGGKDLKSFSNELQKQGTHVAVRQNAQGLMYGVTFVDHVNKTVFNGSDIGKEYGAKGLLEKFNSTEQKESVSKGIKHEINDAKTDNKNVAGEIKKSIQNSNLLDELLQPENQDSYLPIQFRKKKRKKHSKRLRL